MIKEILDKISSESLLSDKIQVYRRALEEIDQIVEELRSRDDSAELRSQVSEELLIYSEKIDELESRLEEEIRLKAQYQEEIVNQIFSMKEEVRNEIMIETTQRLEQFRDQSQQEIEKAVQGQNSLTTIADQIKIFLDFQQSLLIESRDGNYNPITGGYSGAWKWATLAIVIALSLSMGWLIPRLTQKNQLNPTPSQQRMQNRQLPEKTQSRISEFGYSIEANPEFKKKV